MGTSAQRKWIRLLLPLLLFACTRTGEVKELIASAERAKKEGRLRVAADVRLGNLYVKQGKFSAALEVLDHALALNPNDPVAFFNLGLAGEGLGENERSLEAFRKAIVLNPSYTVAHYNLGTLLAKLGRYPEAVQPLHNKRGTLPEMLTRLVRHTRMFAVLSVLLIPFVAYAEDPNEGLLIAAGRGRTAAVQTLLDKGANVNAKDESDSTALIYAALGGHTATVRALLVRGADVNAKNKDGLTALMIAAYDGYTPIVQSLLARGVNLNARDRDGLTALMIAALKGHTSVVKTLLVCCHRTCCTSWGPALARQGRLSHLVGQASLPGRNVFTMFGGSTS